MSGDILAVDPGLTKPGAAFMRDGQIIGAARLPSDRSWAKLQMIERCDRVAWAIVEWMHFSFEDPEPCEVVVEWPQWYGDNRQGIDPNDLAGLCAISGSVVGRLRAAGYVLEARSPKPREVWGTVPKSTKGDPWKSPRGVRLASRLSAPERAAVDNYHDALDAAGLALWAAGRWAARRSYPGAV